MTQITEEKHGCEVRDALEELRGAARGRRVCLGHDWLTGMRGGERVLEWFCRAFPEAPVAAIVGDGALVSPEISSHRLVFSPLMRVPDAVRIYRRLLPLLPFAADAVKIPDCDLLLTTSHCVAKGFRKPAGAKHVCTCFTPMRYAWTFYEEYFGANPVKAAFVKPMLSALRAWDVKRSAGVDSFIAISRHVEKRIRDFYGRGSTVVHPPVDVARCTPDGAVSGDFDLIVSALVPYKRVDLAVEAYTRSGRRLKIVGVGGCEERLRRSAGPSVEFLGRLPDADVLALYRSCRALVFPGEEDYGIVPLEAQACGKPVIAFARGGALETVRGGETGVFFAEQTAEALEEAADRCGRTAWDPSFIRAHAEKFGPVQFLRNTARAIAEAAK